MGVVLPGLGFPPGTASLILAPAAGSGRPKVEILLLCPAIDRFYRHVLREIRTVHTNYPIVEYYGRPASVVQNGHPASSRRMPERREQKSMRKIAIAWLGGLVAMLAIAVPSAGAQSLGACQLDGTAQFSPGLSTSSQPFNYSFGGALEGCQSSQSGVPTSGTVSAGQTIAEQVTNSITGATDTVTYQQPVPTGTGGCASSTTQGEALATWSDGTATVVSYSTTGALAAVHLSGTVVPTHDGERGGRGNRRPCHVHDRNPPATRADRRSACWHSNRPIRPPARRPPARRPPESPGSSGSAASRPRRATPGSEGRGVQPPRPSCPWQAYFSAARISPAARSPDSTAPLR